MLIITESFEKMLNKISSVSIDDVKDEIQKHKNGIDNFKRIATIDIGNVYKGYLFGTKVRFIIVLEEVRGHYIPAYIVKKETKIGRNLSKTSNDLKVIFRNCEKSMQDLRNNKFKKVKLS